MCSRRSARVIAALLVVVSAATHKIWGQERVDLKAPIVQQKTVSTYTLVSLTLQWGPDWVLEVTFKDNTGTVYTDKHLGITDDTNPRGAEVLVLTVTRAALGGRSLERWLLEHLVTEGIIKGGTVTGTPR